MSVIMIVVRALVYNSDLVCSRITYLNGIELNVFYSAHKLVMKLSVFTFVTKGYKAVGCTCVVCESNPNF